MARHLQSTARAGAGHGGVRQVKVSFLLLFCPRTSLWMHVEEMASHEWRVELGHIPDKVVGKLVESALESHNQGQISKSAHARSTNQIGGLGRISCETARKRGLKSGAATAGFGRASEEEVVSMRSRMRRLSSSCRRSPRCHCCC